MSSPFLNPGQQRPPAADWARLIPGKIPPIRVDRKKPVQSVRLPSPERIRRVDAPVGSGAENMLDYFLPAPLKGPMAWRWSRSTATDFVLVSFNWLLLGALLVPLHRLFPQVRVFRYAAGAPVSLLGLAVLHAAFIALLGYVEGVHAVGIGLIKRRRALGKAVFLATAVLCVAYGLQGASLATCGLFCVAGALHFGSLWTWHRRRVRYNSSHRRGETRKVVIVGAGGVGRRVASYLTQHPEAGRLACGFLDDDRPLGNGVIGRVGDLARLARTQFVDGVILAAPRDRQLIQQVLRESQRLRLDLEIVPDLFGFKPALEVEQAGDLLLIGLHAERPPTVWLLLKRIVDVVVAGLALAGLCPLLAVIAALIKLDSAGPVFYCAPRAGRKGRLFRCYKFRTMVSNADALKNNLRQNNERLGPFFKIAADPRITRLGRVLRRYSLDELPQLCNVFKGDMSLVGPRPHPVDDVAGYEIEHLARLDVTPGITGLWQVTARRDPSFQRGMELDREYIQTWSLASDMRILWMTVRVVLTGSGN